MWGKGKHRLPGDNSSLCFIETVQQIDCEAKCNTTDTPNTNTSEVGYDT